MRVELASLVAPIGLHLDWKSLSAPRDGDVSAALVVVTFKGKCEVSGLEAHRPKPAGLAWTHISDGVILPFVDVDCDRLREFLQIRLLQFDGRRREYLFGRALARVVGHELYHVFGETTHHAREGVAQSALTTVQLLSEDFSFAEKDFRTLRTSKLRALLSFARPRTRSGQTEYAAAGCAVCHGATGEGNALGPPLHAPGAKADLKALTARFEKKREEMYRRARVLQLEWPFPSEAEVRSIVQSMRVGVEEADGGSR